MSALCGARGIINSTFSFYRWRNWGSESSNSVIRVCGAGMRSNVLWPGCLSTGGSLNYDSPTPGALCSPASVAWIPWRGNWQNAVPGCPCILTWKVDATLRSTARNTSQCGEPWADPGRVPGLQIKASKDRQEWVSCAALNGTIRTALMPADPGKENTPSPIQESYSLRNNGEFISALPHLRPWAFW